MSSFAQLRWFRRGVRRTEAGVRYSARRFLSVLGPGLITGAADDDPSGIATYAQTGAKYGYSLAWTSLYQLPLMIAVQECCARIGLVTRAGLGALISAHYPRWVLLSLVSLVVVANTINIGADLGAIAEALQLVVPGPAPVYAIGAAVLIVSLEVFVSYRRYAGLLKWTALALLAYPATTFMMHQPWGRIAYDTLVPKLEWNTAFLFIVVGVFGTSISPYMFFWQTSEEIEDAEDRRGAQPEPAKVSSRALFDMRIDTSAGMVAAELAQWFIIITAASTLNAHGITDIRSSAEAARAIEPLVQTFPNSGALARTIFALGIVGLGLIGVPVLAGSTAYAVSDAFGLKQGLTRRFSEAKAFYGVIALSTLAGLAIQFLSVNPFQALVFAAVLNGLAAVPLLWVLAQVNGRKDILGERRGGPISRFTVWLTFAVMALAAVALVATLF